jgi:hypothetical protein
MGRRKRCDPQLQQQRSPKALLFFLINFFCPTHQANEEANEVTFDNFTAPVTCLHSPTDPPPHSHLIFAGDA